MYYSVLIITIFQPGMFACVDTHDVAKFEELISKWCRVDAVHKNGKMLRQYAAANSYHDMVAIIDRNSHTLVR
jgi:NADP-dependent 3-hydroxy acid dehydrogenase YdfG